MKVQIVADLEQLDRLAKIYEKVGLSIIHTEKLEFKAFDSSGKVKHVVRARE